MNAYKFHLVGQRKVKEMCFHENMHCCSRNSSTEWESSEEPVICSRSFCLSAVSVRLWRELILVETDHCLSGLFSLWNHTASQAASSQEHEHMFPEPPIFSGHDAGVGFGWIHRSWITSDLSTRFFFFSGEKYDNYIYSIFQINGTNTVSDHISLIAVFFT